MVKKIVVVRIGGWTDTVLSQFIAPALKERYPQATVTLVLGKSLADWADCLHYDDVIWVNDRFIYSENRLQRMAEFTSAVLKLKQHRFDLGLSLHRTRSYAALLKMAGVQRTVGFQSKKENPAWFARYRNFDEEVVLRPGVPEIDRYLDLLARVGVKPQRLVFKLRVRENVHGDIMLRLARHGLRSKGFVAVGPGGGENAERKFFHKRWTYFPEFLRVLCEKTDKPILLLGGPKDRDLVPPLKNVNPERIQSWVGETSREEALATLGESMAFVGCDSGLAHVSGSVGIPTVVLFGPTTSKIYQPPGVGKNVICLDAQVPCSPCHTDDGQFNWKCRDNVCMKSISPQQVLQSLQKITDSNLWR